MLKRRAALPHFEIFLALPSKQVIWVESATSLDDAKSRVRELEKMLPGNYFIFDKKNACFVVALDADAPAAPETENGPVKSGLIGRIH